MRTYYFDLRGGIPQRDHYGIRFATDDVAIRHSQVVANNIRKDARVTRNDLYVVVIDESGREVHREEVFPSISPAA